MTAHELRHGRLGQVRVGRREECAEVLRVLHEIRDGALLLCLILHRDAGGVVHHEANVPTPETEKRLARSCAVDAANSTRDCLGILVQRARRRLELARE
jgi:hypothetical protein